MMHSAMGDDYRQYCHLQFDLYYVIYRSVLWNSDLSSIKLTFSPRLVFCRIHSLVSAKFRRIHEQYRGNETTSQRIATTGAVTRPNLFRAKRNSCSLELGSSVVDSDSDGAVIGCGSADFCVVIVCGESAVNQHTL